MASHLEIEFLARLREAGLDAGLVTEHQFHETRKWRFDFAWPELKVAAEVEGGTWVKGRHTRGAGYSADAEKYNTAMLDGWMVMRGSGDMVRNGSLLKAVAGALSASKAKVDGDAPEWLDGDIPALEWDESEPVRLAG